LEQQFGFGQLGDRRYEQAAGQIACGSEEDHALDHQNVIPLLRPVDAHVAGQGSSGGQL
jgi:hypothetical protein